VAVVVEASGRKRLGADRPAPGPGLTVLGPAPTTGRVEMTDLCRGLYDHQDWWVTGEGEISAGRAGVVLRPRGAVTVKGVGELFSGVYVLSHVTHAFSAEGYVQRFRVRRNGLRPTGDEDFSGAGSGLAGVLAGVGGAIAGGLG
jgi:hypothetical protein